MLGGSTSWRHLGQAPSEGGPELEQARGSASIRADKNAAFIFFAICNPDNMEKADKALLEVVNELLKKGVGEEELKLAKEGYLQEAKVGRAEDSHLLALSAQNLELGRSMKYHGDLENRVEVLTPSEAAKKQRPGSTLPTPDRLTIIRAGDFTKKSKTPEKK